MQFATDNRQIQICCGSSGSGSRTGASGFPMGLGGSLIGGGIGSVGVRLETGNRASDFESGVMAFRCWSRKKGSHREKSAQPAFP
jgi:hypothetical protein